MEKKLFKILKNGKKITIFYRQDEDVIYTVYLGHKNGSFFVHYYIFDGNDVFDDENYKDEQTINVDNFNELLELVKERFPGMIEKWIDKTKPSELAS